MFATMFILMLLKRRASALFCLKFQTVKVKAVLYFTEDNINIKYKNVW